MSGKFGSAELLANQDNLVCTAPASKITTVTVFVVNRGNTPSMLKIAVGSGVSPLAKDYIYFDEIIEPNKTMVTPPIVMSAGENIWINPNEDNISARVQGFGD